MKKVIQSKAFRESAAQMAKSARRDAKEASERDGIDPRLQVAFKAWLESEADAAAIIHAMSFRVVHKSELATKARNYAARLRLYVARLSALLPPHMQVRYDAFAIPIQSKPALTPRTCEQAAFVLVESSSCITPKLAEKSPYRCETTSKHGSASD